MIKAGDRVIAKIKFNGAIETKIRTVKEVIETPEGKFYHIENDFNGLIHESKVLEILPEKKDRLYVTVGYAKGVRDIISEAVCELQGYATNEHSYYTKDGKEMLSTWKQKGDHVYDVHVFEKVTECNWKQLS